MNLLKKLFLMQSWDIGFSFSEITSPNALKSIRFNIIKSTLKEWYADPFCVTFNGNHYIFCEVFRQKYGKGSIGVFEYNNEKFKKCHIIIDEPFHMSYPNVFQHGDRWYMIPETSASKELRLYQATTFPFEWKLIKILKKDVMYVDSTLVHFGNKKTKLLCYDISESNKKLVSYFIKLGTFDMEFCDEIYDNEELLRPAGNIFSDSFFVSQKNSNYYGEALIFNSLTNHEISSNAPLIIQSKHMSLKNNKYIGIHTFNTSTNFVVVDLLKKSFKILKPFFYFARKRNKNDR